LHWQCASADPDFNQGICNNKNADDKFGEICSGLGVSIVSYGFRSGDLPKRYEADCTRNPLALDRLLTKTKDEDYLLFKLVGQCELPSGLLSITDRDVILTGAEIVSNEDGFVSSCANLSWRDLFQTAIVPISAQPSQQLRVYSEFALI